MTTLQEKSTRINNKRSSASISENNTFFNNLEEATNPITPSDISFVKTEKEIYGADSISSATNLGRNTDKNANHFDDSSVKNPSNSAGNQIASFSSSVPDAHGKLVGTIVLTTSQLDHDSLTQTFEKISNHQLEGETHLESKIDIQEHLLKEEQIESIVVNKKARRHTEASFYDIIESLSILCDICDDRTAQRVIKLNKQERFAAVIVLKTSLSLGLKPKRIFSPKIPEKSCGRCFTRIILFRNHLKNIFLKQRIKKETAMEPSLSHGYECSCVSCQNRYGQLRLIVRGIETLSSDTMIDTILEAEPHVQDTSEESNMMDLDELGESENPQGQQDFQHQQLFNRAPPASSSEHLLFSRQSDIGQSIHTPVSHISHFHNISNRPNVAVSESISCFDASATTTISCAQSRDTQTNFQSYSGYSGSPSQTLLYTHTNIGERSQIDPIRQPTTSSTYQGNHGHREEYSGYPGRAQSQTPITAHLSIDERYRICSCPPSTSNTYRDEHHRPHEDTYSSYSGSHSQGFVTHPSSADICSREAVNSLPTMLEEFEGGSQIDLSQPSTSGGYSSQRQSEEETPRKTRRICRYCQKQFTHTGDFRKHLRKHTKEKPYACNQCDKRFSHTSNLHRHERSHTGDRPYRCEFCNKEFNRKDKLDSHRKSRSCKSKRSDGWK